MTELTVLESLFVGVFGMGVVFLVLVGLILLLRLQSALTGSPRNKTAQTAVGDTPAAPVEAPAPPPAEAVTRPTVVPAQPAAVLTDRQSASFGRSVITANKLALTVNAKTYEVEVEEVTGVPAREAAETPRPVPAASKTAAPKPASPAPAAAPTAPAPAAKAGGELITAPVAGTVMDIKTTPGAAVKRGEILLLLEAMKMENEIVAPRDGTVKSVLTSKGAAVDTGAPLIEIQ
jgi:glutaconyl-CoA decarboxylase